MNCVVSDVSFLFVPSKAGGQYDLPKNRSTRLLVDRPIVFISISERQKMPLDQTSGKEEVPRAGVDLDGSLAAVPAGARLTDSARKDIHETLRKRNDSTGIVIVFGDHWFTRLFAEVWTALPNRLASLAIRPPAACCQSFPRGFDPSRLAEQMPSSIASSFPQWSLMKLAKSHSGLEVRTVPLEWTSAQARAQAADLDERGLPDLLSSPPRRELEWLFNELRLARLSDVCGTVVSPVDATAVLAGLWLLHGDAETSHRHSQSIEDQGRHRCGNYWHAIMHRQEPDYGNSKYWFRRVGQHPMFPELARRADELIVADGSQSARRWREKLGTPKFWNACAFVDWCESALREGEGTQISLLRRIQFVEMQLLLRASYLDATRK